MKPWGKSKKSCVVWAMDLRWGGGDLNRIRALAQELVGLQPDSKVILDPETGAVDDGGGE
jgi:hypothetical protein